MTEWFSILLIVSILLILSEFLHAERKMKYTAPTMQSAAQR